MVPQHPHGEVSPPESSAARSPWIVRFPTANSNAWFVWSAVRVLRERSDRAARRMFRVSLAYLFSLFLAMNAELLLIR